MKKRASIYILVIVLFVFKVSDLISVENNDLIDITTLDSTIIVDIKYATSNNFMNEKLYSANICLLQRAVAERLIKVQKNLKKQGYGLKVWDGYRPLSVQKKMWKKMPYPGYVANPKFGSNHNRGAAVDVTLVDSLGCDIEMPTQFDDFSEKAGSSYQNLSKLAIKHRTILQNAMKAQGFQVIKSEWWHFNDKDVKKYPVIDVPLKNFVNEGMK